MKAAPAAPPLRDAPEHSGADQRQRLRGAPPSAVGRPTLTPPRRTPKYGETHWGRKLPIGVGNHLLGQVSPHWGRLITCPNDPLPTPMWFHARQVPQWPTQPAFS